MRIQYYWYKIIKKLHGRGIKNSQIHKTSKVEAESEIVNSVFGKYSFCGYNCQIINTEIGSFCSIANNVIIGGAMHPMKWVSTSPVFYEGRDSVKEKFSFHKRENPGITTIGNDVWIGNGAIIKQGITIGTGAVIGMGSVVTKNVDPYSIVAGTPAKVIRKRFNDEMCNALLKSKWWTLPHAEIKKRAYNFINPELFLKELGK